ncbi:hypothetical protein [Microbacterium luticocti]|uniref:hypothetical protein n=1 Tax=Microbacterium luticocti TaxID=451764 RepID=UPI0012EC8F58|nr:hypothetical protein [Microbacterium luticocti]
MRELVTKSWIKHVFTLAISAALLVPLSAATAANADEGRTSSAYSEIYQWYVDHGVENDVAAQLAENILDGNMPLSSRSDAMPVSEDRYRDGGWVVTVRHFADGSLTESRLEEPAPPVSGGVRPMTVGSCEGTSSGTNYINYSNCRVEEKTAYLVLSFRADYTRAYGVGVIDAVRQPYSYSVGGTAATPSLSITKSASNSSGPATAVGRTVFKTLYSSATVSIKLSVNGTSAKTSRSGF